MLVESNLSRLAESNLSRGRFDRRMVLTYRVVKSRDVVYDVVA
jgi:hypothetical protein